MGASENLPLTGPAAFLLAAIGFFVSRDVKHMGGAFGQSEFQPPLVLPCFLAVSFLLLASGTRKNWNTPVGTPSRGRWPDHTLK